MIRSVLHVDTTLTHVEDIVAIHQYPSIVGNGFAVWQTKDSDSLDDDGKFNRYVEWGPFRKLVELLEKMNLMDNKIVVEYENGLFIGFYDGKVKVGTDVCHLSEKYVVNKDKIMERFQKYCKS